MRKRKFKIYFLGKEEEVEVEDLGGNSEEDLKPKSSVEDEIEILVGNEEYGLRVEEVIVPSVGATPSPPPPPKPIKTEKEVAVVEGTPVKAPMRGTITKILVKVGDKVNKGDPVVVLEAMKMENLIESPVSGVVKQIITSVGSSVATGDPLVIVG